MSETIRVYWRSLALTALAVLCFGQLFVLGQRLEMDTKYFSFRFMNQGLVASALTSMVSDNAHNFTYNSLVWRVAEKYWNIEHDVPLTAIVDEARKAIQEPGGVYPMVVDDKGYVDFLRVAFRLFGFHRTSVYYTYFLFMGLTFGTYVVLFFRRPAYLAGLVCFIAALYVTAPLTLIDDQLYSLHDPRFLSVLGIVPLMTLLLVMAEAELSLASVCAVALQAAALVAVYFCRNSSLWQSLCVVAAVPMCYWRLRRRTWRPAVLLLRLSYAPVLLALAFYALDQYQDRMFHRDYFIQGFEEHPYSHNLIMGFSYHPALAKRYQIAVDDLSVVHLVGRRLVAKGEIDSPGDAEFILNTDLNRYSAEARGAIQDILLDHPKESLTVFLKYKLEAIAQELLFAAGSRGVPDSPARGSHRLASEEMRGEKDLYYRPFRPLVLFVVLLACVLAAGASARDWSAVQASACMVALFSLTIPVGVIPMLYLMAPAIVAVTTLGYVTVTVQAAKSVVRVTNRSRLMLTARATAESMMCPEQPPMWARLRADLQSRIHRRSTAHASCPAEGSTSSSKL